jgi:catechol 2,3-dioxygenase-like lactoylglutathione lyase family enzyme
VVVGVEDLDSALRHWEGHLGMEVARRQPGRAPQLAGLWGLPADAISGQALLNAPGLIDGGVQLVELRHGARVPRGALHALGAAVRDLELRAAQLRGAGLRAASGIQPGALGRREQRFALPDTVELALVEAPDSRGVPARAAFGVATHVEIRTLELASEARFFQEVLGLHVLSREEGASAGAGGGPRRREAWLLGSRESLHGRILLVEGDLASRRAAGASSARGLRGLVYVVPDLRPVLQRGAAHGVRAHGEIDTLLGRGRMATLTSPAGVRIDIIEQ